MSNYQLIAVIILKFLIVIILPSVILLFTISTNSTFEYTYFILFTS